MHDNTLSQTWRTFSKAQSALLWLCVFLGIGLGAMATRYQEIPLAAVGLVVLFGLFVVRPYWGYVLVCIVTMLTIVRFPTPLGQLRPDQVLAVTSIPFLISRHLRGNSGRDPLGIAIGIWLLVNMVASFFAPFPFASEKIVIWLGTDLVLYLFARAIVVEWGYMKAFLPFYLSAVVEVLVGIGLFFIHYHVAGYRAQGTMWEPDIFGSLCGVVVVVSAFLMTRRGWSRITLIALFVGAAGLVVSGTRSSSFGVLVAVGCAFLFIPAMRSRVATWIAGLSLASIVVAKVTSSTTLSRLVHIRTSGTLLYRTLPDSQAMRDFGRSLRALILGHGTDAFGQTHFHLVQGQVVANYIPTQLVTVPYDTGIMGMMAFGAMLWVLFSTWRRLSALNDDNLVALGLRYALLATLVAYQATNGIWFAFTWVMLALSIPPPTPMQNMRDSPSGQTVGSQSLLQVVPY